MYIAKPPYSLAWINIENWLNCLCSCWLGYLFTLFTEFTCHIIILLFYFLVHIVLFSCKTQVFSTQIFKIAKKQAYCGLFPGGFPSSLGGIPYPQNPRKALPLRMPRELLRFIIWFLVLYEHFLYNRYFINVWVFTPECLDISWRIYWDFK